MVDSANGPANHRSAFLRFGLRRLLWLVACFAIGLATWRAVGPQMGLALLAFFIAIAAHIFGNALGNHLRDSSPRRIDHRMELPVVESSISGTDQELPERFAPVTCLSRRTPLGWFLPSITFVGACTGAVVSGRWLILQYSETATVTTVAVGASAIGVLVGFVTFWCFALLQVFLGAWWQANRHSSR